MYGKLSIFLQLNLVYLSYNVYIFVTFTTFRFFEILSWLTTVDNVE